MIGNVNSQKFETVHTIFPSLSQTVAPGPNIRSPHNYAVFHPQAPFLQNKDKNYSLNYEGKYSKKFLVSDFSSVVFSFSAKL